MQQDPCRKERFVQLRLSSMPLRAVAEQLGIDLSTAMDWEEEFAARIAEGRAARLPRRNAQSAPLADEPLRQEAGSWPSLSFVALTGCLLTVLGFFLPWAPAGGARFRDGVTRIVSTYQNPTAQAAEVVDSNLGRTHLLLPGETLYKGEDGSFKITAPDGSTRLISHAMKHYGADMGAWGYGSLALGLAGAVMALVGLKNACAKLAHPALLLCSSGVLLLATFVFEAARTRAASLSQDFDFSAAFGDIDSCLGLLSVAIGGAVALLATVGLFLTRRKAGVSA